ncbi:netrin-4-like [Syngnathoides biaculeatus]|uniref:netrin-4-like n=1 Tax=Syngnathoides biaculeatus TaxID=300417 RepID=UPI002ADDF718|nr:netrin-4-like [Syngnathoides biaculeatus]
MQTAATSPSEHGSPLEARAAGSVIAVGTTPLGTGCWCDPQGSRSPHPGDEGTCCHHRSEQCKCQAGVGGTSCTHCMPGYWGFGAKGCKACAWPNSCNPTTGQCLDSNINKLFNIPSGGKIPTLDSQFVMDEGAQWPKVQAVSVLHSSVIKESVMSAHDKGSHAEVQVKVREVLRSDLIALSSETISVSWTSRGCTILNPGMEYLLGGPEESSTGRLLVTIQSVVVPWTARLGLLITDSRRRGCLRRTVSKTFKNSIQEVSKGETENYWSQVATLAETHKILKLMVKR